MVPMSCAHLAARKDCGISVFQEINLPLLCMMVDYPSAALRGITGMCVLRRSPLFQEGRF